MTDDAPTTTALVPASVNAVDISRAKVHEYLPKALASLVDLMENANSEKVRLDAAIVVIEQAIGKPTTHTEVSNNLTVDPNELAEKLRQTRSQLDEPLEDPDEEAVVLTANGEGTFILSSPNPDIEVEL